MIQEIRNQAADWLQMVIDQVEKVTNHGDPIKFNMGRYVTVWDAEHRCGTCCCIEGWLPVIIPNKAEWSSDGTTVQVKGTTWGFYPEFIEVPIKSRLWSDLTISPASKDFPTVKCLWLDTIKEIREGKKDHLLITLNEED